MGQDAVRVGVVGCGFFGGLHARKYAEAGHAQLMGVADLDEASAAKVAGEYGTESYADPSALFGKVDAVSITAPAAYHYSLAKQFLEQGVHVLVEKPIALELGHADDLIALAATKNLVLQVGHQERYVFEDFGVLARDIAPQEIVARRAGPFTGRAMDVSAVFDLMIHDLDLIHQVSPAPVVNVEARGKTVHGEFPDEVTVTLTLEDGCAVKVLASRIAEKRQRDMRLVYPDGIVEIDFINRIMTNSTQAQLQNSFEGNAASQEIMQDPLGYGIRAFVESVRLGQPPRVTGEQARLALDTALKITKTLAA